MSQLTNINEIFSENDRKKYDNNKEVKTMNMISTQNDLLSQFEFNLQKTFEILSKQQHILKKDRDFIETDETIGLSTALTLNDAESFRGDPKNFGVKNAQTPDFKDENNTHSMSQRENRLHVDDHSKQLGDVKKFSKLLNEECLRHMSLDKVISGGENIENLKKKINDLDNENEKLRGDIVSIKIDSFQKYEVLQKNNDALLVSYENKVNLY